MKIYRGEEEKLECEELSWRRISSVYEWYVRMRRSEDSLGRCLSVFLFFSLSLCLYTRMKEKSRVLGRQMEDDDVLFSLLFQREKFS